MIYRTLFSQCTASTILVLKPLHLIKVSVIEMEKCDRVFDYRGDQTQNPEPSGRLFIWSRVQFMAKAKLVVPLQQVKLSYLKLEDRFELQNLALLLPLEASFLSFLLWADPLPTAMTIDWADPLAYCHVKSKW